MRRLRRPVESDRRGVAVLEFAVLLPLALLVMVGLADLVHLGRGYLRVHSAAVQIGQIVSQCPRPTNGADEQLLADLTKRILGSFADDNAQWRLVITVFGRDNTPGTGTNINWNVQRSGGAPRGGAPALVVNPSGARMPAGFTTGQNRVLFRTEVFASLDRTTLTRLTSLISNKVSLGFETAHAEAVHTTRLANTDDLKPTNSRGCLT